MNKFTIELNGVCVKQYASLSKAKSLYLAYAKNENNTVRIWHNGEIVMESEE